MTNNIMINEIDFKQLTPAMLNRIINNPTEASGCIQCLLETVSRRDDLIKHLEFSLDHSEDSTNLSWKLIEELMTFYILPPWYKRVWNAVMGNREKTVGTVAKETVNGRTES